MEWISVKDKMPEFDEYVLIYAKGEIVRAFLYTTKYGNFWSTCEDDIRHADVTHWMPMPQPPKD